MTNEQLIKKLQAEATNLQNLTKEVEQIGFNMSDGFVEALEFIYKARHEIDNAQRAIFADNIKKAQMD